MFFSPSARPRQASRRDDSPLITDDPGTVATRHWEINTAFTLEALQGQTNLEVPLLDINYGADAHTQLKFEMPFAVQTATGTTLAGPGNPKVGVKWRFVDEDTRGVAVSTYPQFSFSGPASSVRRGLADDGWQMFLPIEVAKTFGKFELGGEAGYNIQQRRPDEIWLGLASGYQASSRLELLAELHSIGSNHFAENESVFDLGSRIKLTKLNTLLLAAGRSLPGSTGGQPRFFLYSALQFTF